LQLLQAAVVKPMFVWLPFRRKERTGRAERRVLDRGRAGSPGGGTHLACAAGAIAELAIVLPALAFPGIICHQLLYSLIKSL
jgi:hypothetical protein